MLFLFPPLFFFKYLTVLFIYLILFLAMPCSMQDPIPWPGMEPLPPALEVWSPNHWTTTGSLPPLSFNFLFLILPLWG